MDRLTTRVLVADDDPDFRDGVVALLAQAQFIEVVGVAADGREAIIAVKKSSPDIILMDVSMPEFDGLLATKFLSEIAPSARIIAVSAYIDSVYVKRMLDAGASAYVAKSRAQLDIVAAVEAVVAEQFFMSPNIDSSVLREIG